MDLQTGLSRRHKGEACKNHNGQKRKAQPPPCWFRRSLFRFLKLREPLLDAGITIEYVDDEACKNDEAQGIGGDDEAA